MCLCFVFGLTNASLADENYTITLKVSSAMPIDTTFQFNIYAKGTFYIDCGENGTLSANNATISGNTISKTSVNSSTIGCKYTGDLAERTIRIGGKATQYVGSYIQANRSALLFGSAAAKSYLKSIEGDLSAVFPAGTSNATTPGFNGTFSGCTGLESISDNLFAGYTRGIAYMFQQTFNGCSGLTGPIPPTLFEGLIANNVAYSSNMMKNIFSGSGFAQSCDPALGLVRYETRYDSYWSPKVSCISTSMEQQCSSGYYLPHNTLVCTACPTGYTCAGGTYTFDETNDQGLVPSTYTCSNGYFLPANATSCSACPTGYTCAGGTYTFDPTNDQGITMSYTVTYSCGSGTGNPPISNINIVPNQAVSPAVNSCVAPTGYGSFVGWEVSGTNDIKTPETAFTWEYTEDKTFTAKWAPNTYTVTYSCDSGTGNPPTTNTSATYDSSFTPAESTCTPPSGQRFVGWAVSGTDDVISSTVVWQYIEDKTLTAQYKTYSVSFRTINFDGSTSRAIGFKMMAAGTFYVNCGDGGTLYLNVDSNNYSTDGNKGMFITNNVDIGAQIICSYSTDGVKTVYFEGEATGYYSNWDNSALTFYFSDYRTNLAAISGDLSAVFPDLGINQTQHPSFFNAFVGCSNLTEISDTLLSGYTTAQAKMFYSMFKQTGLQELPPHLLANITSFDQSGQSYAFNEMFQGCRISGYIPSTFFQGLLGQPVGNYAGAMTRIFNGNSSMATSCNGYPETIQYVTGYESSWNNKVMCGPKIICPVGQYLPMGTTTCSACPSGEICIGGTFGYHYNQDQGFGSAFNVSYSCGSGAGNPPTTNTTAVPGETFTPATNSCSAPNGYNGFAGWLVSGTDDVVASAFTWEYAEDKTLTAQYTPNTIFLRWWNGTSMLTVPNESQTCEYNELLNVPSAPTAPAGYMFSGWRLKTNE